MMSSPCTLAESRIVYDKDSVLHLGAKWCPFPDETFYLVVFDPPHLHHIGETAWMAKKYGVLKGNWKAVLRDGFRECMRVLKPGGTLVFKWSEVQIRVGQIWEAIGERPIFGTRCGKSAKTIWACFFKSAYKNNQTTEP